MTLEVGEPGLASPTSSDWRPDPFPDLSRADGPVAFDTEGSGLRWWRDDRPCGTAVAWREGGELRSAYLPTGHVPGGNHDPERFLEWARSELRGKTLVGLRLVYDAHMSRVGGLDLEELGCRMADVGHRAALLDDHRKKFKLEDVAQDELGKGKVKGIDVTGGAHRYHPSRVAEYARRDVELPLRIYERQAPRLEAEDLLRVAELEEDVIWPVVEMERNGARLDVEKLRAWARASEKDETRLAFRVARAAGFPVNPRSDGDMERLYHERGHDVGRTADGHVRRSDDVLAELAKGDEVVALVRELAQFRSLREKFVLPYAKAVGDDGVLRFSLNQLPVERFEGGKVGTISGRFSCVAPMRGEGANLQQVMTVKRHLKRFGDRYVTRELLVPEPGALLLDADASQIEYRIFAHYANDARILEEYRRNPRADFHELMAEMIRRYRPGFPRDDAKNGNFAFLFGAGADRGSEMLRIPLEDARELYMLYHRANPSAKRLLKAVKNQALARGRQHGVGYVRTILGRRARFHPCPHHGWDDVRGCPACPRLFKALNSVDQGSAADVMKVKLRELHRARRRLGLTLRMTIHDEVLGDVPDLEAARLVGELLDEQSLEFRVPIVWQVGTGASWREAK